MIKSYLKIAWRTLLKNKALFFINTLGLAIGIATCLIISLYVNDELSYDRFNENADQISRVILKAKIGEEIIEEASVPPPISATLVEEFPEVLKAVRIFSDLGTPKITFEEKTLREGQFAFADPNFFEIFTFPLIKGDPLNALSQPNSVVLTQRQAKKYFGDLDPMDKILEIEGVGFYGNNGYTNNEGLYTVTGVMEEMPDNSHFHFDILASMSSNKDAVHDSWVSGSYHSYLLLDKSTTAAQFETKLPGIVDKYMSAQMEDAMGMPFSEYLESGNELGLYMEPIKDIHFSKLKGIEPGGNQNTVYMMGAVALLMLLIACINFMNLSTASASKRLKEIGMRKVLGSDKGQLIFQFLTESFISTAIAMIIGVGILTLALPSFNQLSNKSFEFGNLLTPQILLSLGGLTFLISILAGAYPAFFMSSFEPLKALKNRFTSGGSKWVRSSLVVFQFAVSVCLIIGTIVVGQQMKYIQNKDVGYERDELIVLRDAGRLGNSLSSFKDDLRQDPRIESLTTSAFIPAGPSDNYGQMVVSKHEVPQKLRTKIYGIDEDYVTTLGMEILSGRNFSTDFGSEENNIIVNETAIGTFGLDDDPIGQILQVGIQSNQGFKDMTIVGVVKDFHAQSLHQSIEPMIMKFDPYYGLIIKAKSTEITGLLSDIQDKWVSYGSGENFEYAFLDELYNETYIREQNMSIILQAFSFLTIFVACLGLFGLVTFTAEQRFKEIGIRKVLGSSVFQIVTILSKDFVKLVCISFLIAFPIGYYFMNNWLQSFSYRINIEWWIFAIAGVITILIAFATISFKSIKAAVANPIKSIRAE